MKIAMLSLAAVLLAATTLVGPAVQVFPPIAGAVPMGHAVGAGDTTQNYLGVETLVLPGAGGVFSGIIRTALIDSATGSAGAPATIWTGTTAAFNASLAWNDSTARYLLVVTTSIDNVTQVGGLVLDGGGALVGGTALFPISGGAGGSMLPPRVASHGNGWLVVWEGVDSSPTRFSLRGRFLDGASTNAAPVFSSPMIEIAPPVVANYAESGLAFRPESGFFVAWERGSYTNTSGVFEPAAFEGRGISASGVLGTTRRYLSGSPDRSGLSVAAGADGYLAAWCDYSYYYGAISALRFDAGGAASGPPGVIHRADSEANGGLGRIDPKTFRLVWNRPSNRWFAAWTDTAFTDVPVAKPVGLSLSADLEPAESLVLLAPSGIPTTYSGNPPMVSAASSLYSDSRVVVQWSSPWGVGTGDVGARVCDLAGIHAPAAPAAGQYRLDGATPIAAGAVVNQTAFVVRAPVADADGDLVRIEVDVAEVGTPLTAASPVSGAAVAGGSVASVTVPLPGFAPGKAYHWRARTVDSTGAVSRWKPFGSDPDSPSEADLSVRATNEAPSFASIGQFRVDGVEIPEGGSLADRSVVIHARADDADGDEVQVDIELRPADQAFSGTPTSTAAFGAAGRPAEILVDLDGAPDGSAYHWQARVTDSFGRPSPWVGYGGAASDFAFLLYGSSSPNSCHGTVAGLAQGGMALAALLLLGFRKR